MKKITMCAFRTKGNWRVKSNRITCNNCGTQFESLTLFDEHIETMPRPMVVRL